MSPREFIFDLHHPVLLLSLSPVWEDEIPVQWLLNLHFQKSVLLGLGVPLLQQLEREHLPTASPLARLRGRGTFRI